MGWWIAHTVCVTKVIDGDQDTYPIYDSCLLIEAKTISEAGKSAENLAKMKADITREVQLNSKPAENLFVGIRKIFSLSSSDTFSVEQLQHGSQLTSYMFKVDERADIRKLVENKSEVDVQVSTM